MVSCLVYVVTLISVSISRPRQSLPSNVGVGDSETLMKSYNINSMCVGRVTDT